MARTIFPDRRFDPSFLRKAALLIIGWVVFITLIPNFFMRLFHWEAPWIGAITWTVGILLFAALIGYLCLGFLRDRIISQLVFWGILFLFAVQVFRISINVGVIDVGPEWFNAVWAIDNLFNGLGIAMVGLAFLFVIIEILASRYQLFEEHTHLSEEVVRREKVEKNLRERETLLRSINTSALDGIIVIDNAGCVTFWNPAAERVLGYRSAEIIGKPIHEILALEGVRNAAAEGLAVWQNTGEGPIIGQTTAVKAVRKDGAELDVELSVSSMELEGQRNAVGILRDVTRRKQAEKEYRTVLQIAMDGFLIADHEGRFLEVNDAYCEMLGYTRAELLNSSIQDVEASETQEEVVANMQRVQQRGFARFETRHRRKDRSLVDVEVSVNSGFRGNDVRMYAFLRDITQRKRLEEERRDFEARVQYAQKLEGLGMLAGGIAHDFNNILQIILGNVNLLEKLVTPTSPSEKYLTRTKGAVERASALTHQMLAYAGRRGFELQALNIGEVVGEMLHLIQSSLSKKVLLQATFAENLPLIEADVTQIEQVAMNLIMNAAESIDEEQGGVVSVSTKSLYCKEAYLSQTRALHQPSEGDYVCLEVRDAGCGMSKETMEKLFEPFYTTKFTGRGLGLSAVLGIVHAHKGAIMVESEPGEGTTIHVLFPAAAASAGISADKASHKPVTPENENRTILIVDDEPDVLDLGAAMLEQLGYKVLTAADGLQATKVFRAHREDVNCILLDLGMPHMDGIQAHLELRKIRPDIPIILASGYAEKDIEPQLAGHAISALLEKPYDVNVLARTLREVLN